jgi:hypothetical protein
MTRNSGCLIFVLTSLSRRLAEGNNFLNRVITGMVLSVRSGNETPKHAMENISVTETKKSTHVTSPSEDNAIFYGHCSL